MINGKIFEKHLFFKSALLLYHNYFSLFLKYFLKIIINEIYSFILHPTPGPPPPAIPSSISPLPLLL